MGKAVGKAVDNVNNIIAQEIIGTSVLNKKILISL